jgi:hypothetical protein
MARKKKKEEDMPSSTSRHKPRKMVPIQERLHALLKELAERNDRPMSREIRTAIISHLEKAGLWPPTQAS